MTTAKPLYINAVRQRAGLIVNEEGTEEAWAVTTDDFALGAEHEDRTQTSGDGPSFPVFHMRTHYGHDSLHGTGEQSEQSGTRRADIGLASCAARSCGVEEELAVRPIAASEASGRRSRGIPGEIAAAHQIMLRRRPRNESPRRRSGCISQFCCAQGATGYLTGAGTIYYNTGIL